LVETRKLAAILAADVVGYSRLAGSDEDRTLARLRALFSDLIDPTIAVHNGRVVKRIGDGRIVEFRSVVDMERIARRRRRYPNWRVKLRGILRPHLALHDLEVLTLPVGTRGH
jgi:class 3 adenylate cyclase